MKILTNRLNYILRIIYSEFMKDLFKFTAQSFSTMLGVFLEFDNEKKTLKWKLLESQVTSNSSKKKNILKTRPDFIIINKQKENLKIVDSAVLANHRIKLKK